MLQVAYTASNGAPEKRRALLTATQGRLLGPGKAAIARGYHADRRCSARMYLGPHSISSASSIINDADLFTSYVTTLEVRTSSSSGLDKGTCVHIGAWAAASLPAGPATHPGAPLREGESNSPHMPSVSACGLCLLPDGRGVVRPSSCWRPCMLPLQLPCSAAGSVTITSSSASHECPGYDCGIGNIGRCVCRV